jgi:hypothetical protein
LISDGQIIEKTRADIYRKDLKYKKVHPSGKCAFSFNLNEKINIKDTYVRIKNSDIKLMPK